MRACVCVRACMCRCSATIQILNNAQYFQIFRIFFSDVCVWVDCKREGAWVQFCRSLYAIPRGSNGYARIDIRFQDKNDKSVQTR